MINNRRIGALVGAVVGDLVGLPHEFSDPSAIPAGRLMPTGGGPFCFAPGVGSDDTDLLFAIVEGYNSRREFDANQALDNMLDWYEAGPQDVGNQTSAALEHWLEDRCPPTDEAAQGNGGLMRAAAHGIMAKTLYRAGVYAADDTRLTHPSQVAADCSAHQAQMVWRMIHSPDTVQMLVPRGPVVGRQCLRPYNVDVSDESGHCLHSIRLAMHVLETAESFEEGIDRVVRTGGDTDTNAAIAGALLGARFGENNIPTDWVRAIGPPLRERIEKTRGKFRVREVEESLL